MIIWTGILHLNSIDIIHELNPGNSKSFNNNAVQKLIQTGTIILITGTNAGYEMRTAPFLLQKWGFVQLN
jgi:hypothetical protein